jgi:hypothetical protein
MPELPPTRQQNDIEKRENYKQIRIERKARIKWSLHRIGRSREGNRP